MRQENSAKGRRGLHGNKLYEPGRTWLNAFLHSMRLMVERHEVNSANFFFYVQPALTSTINDVPKKNKKGKRVA